MCLQNQQQQQHQSQRQWSNHQNWVRSVFSFDLQPCVPTFMPCLSCLPVNFDVFFVCLSVCSNYFVFERDINVNNSVLTVYIIYKKVLDETRYSSLSNLNLFDEIIDSFLRETQNLLRISRRSRSYNTYKHHNSNLNPNNPNNTNTINNNEIERTLFTSQRYQNLQNCQYDCHSRAGTKRSFQTNTYATDPVHFILFIYISFQAILSYNPNVHVAWKCVTFQSQI